MPKEKFVIRLSKKKKKRSKLPICLEFYCSSDSTLSFTNHYLHFVVVATVGMHENRKVVLRGLIKVLINRFKVANEGEKEKTLGEKNKEKTKTKKILCLNVLSVGKEHEVKVRMKEIEKTTKRTEAFKLRHLAINAMLSLCNNTRLFLERI